MNVVALVLLGCPNLLAAAGAFCPPEGNRPSQSAPPIVSTPLRICASSWRAVGCAKPSGDMQCHSSVLGACCGDLGALRGGGDAEDGGGREPDGVGQSGPRRSLAALEESLGGGGEGGFGQDGFRGRRDFGEGGGFSGGYGRGRGRGWDGGGWRGRGGFGRGGRGGFRGRREEGEGGPGRGEEDDSGPGESRFDALDPEKVRLIEAAMAQEDEEPRAPRGDEGGWGGGARGGRGFGGGWGGGGGGGARRPPMLTGANAETFDDEPAPYPLPSLRSPPPSPQAALSAARAAQRVTPSRTPRVAG